MQSKVFASILALVTVLFLSACAPLPAANNGSNTSNWTMPATPSTGMTGGATVDTTPVETEPTTPPKTDDSQFAAHVTYTEGERIELKSLAVDPDGGKPQLTFSKPFENDGVWQTAVGDAGDYPVTVTATDSDGGKSTIQILVSVGYANRPPVFKGRDTVSVKEGDTVDLGDITATDADSDDVILSFSGWMKSSKYTTTYSDAGTHTVTVTAEDGKGGHSVKWPVTVNVENVNRAPSFGILNDRYETTEEKTVTFRASAVDPDGDPVTVTYGKPLDEKSGSWTPALDQAGDYDITLTASDGTDSTTKTVVLHVNAANRAPVINVPTTDGVLHLKEGDLVDLTKLLDIQDAEGEEITVRYSGWMKTATYETTFEDAGNHEVTVTAEDESDHVVTKKVTIEVEDVNRPPVFVRPA